MNERCLKAGLKIDRSQFYPVKNEKIRRAFDGFIRTISKRDSVVYKLETPDDFTHLKNLNWAIQDEFINISKLIVIIENNKTIIILLLKMYTNKHNTANKNML